MFNVWKVLSPLQYCKVVPAVIAGSFELNVAQSVEDKYPLTKVVATGIDIVFVVLTKGLENVNALSLLLNVVQSAELKAPRLAAEAVGTFKVITGVVVPVATVLDKSVPVVVNVKAATDVTVPAVSWEVKAKVPVALGSV